MNNKRIEEIRLRLREIAETKREMAQEQLDLDLELQCLTAPAWVLVVGLTHKQVVFKDHMHTGYGKKVYSNDDLWIKWSDGAGCLNVTGVRGQGIFSKSVHIGDALVCMTAAAGKAMLIMVVRTEEEANMIKTRTEQMLRILRGVNAEPARDDVIDAEFEEPEPGQG